jgi:hypothetical protein
VLEQSFILRRAADVSYENSKKVLQDGKSAVPETENGATREGKLPSTERTTKQTKKTKSTINEKIFFTKNQCFHFVAIAI